MLFVSEISQAELITLQFMERNHPLSWTRIRANSLLLSNQSIDIQKISIIHGVCRQTVSTWLSDWNKYGLCGLVDEEGRGRNPMISSANEEEIIKMVESSPRSLKHVLSAIEKKFDLKICISTLKKICKKAKISWKRVRRSLKGKRDPEKFEQSVKMIENLVEQEVNGDIDLYFFDESGFTLEPCVPYAWQHVNETIEIPASKSKRLNVLGFVNRNCQFESYVVEGSVNSAVVVACFDSFAKTIKKKTEVIIDNASTHTSQEFLENINKWEKQGLFVKPIAPYSPELNIIEILWRKIKYEWLPFSAYESYNSLKNSLFDILKNIGTSSEYHINFA